MKAKELLTMPLVIIILSIVVYLIGDTFNHPLLQLFFPQSDTNTEIIKIFFTSFLLIYLYDFLFTNDEINNLLLSRVGALLIMIIVTYFLYPIGAKYGHVGLIATILISVIYGQYVSLKVQTFAIKNSDILAIILQVLITIFVTYLVDVLA